MNIAKPPYEKYVFVCDNKRADGRPSCGDGGARLRELLKEVVRSERLGERIRICRSGCLDACEKGPNVLVQPDQVFFHRVEDSDLPKILDAFRAPQTS